MNNTISVTVIGAGLMGHGIAQVFARAGHYVVLTDTNTAVLDEAKFLIKQNLEEEGIDPAPILQKISIESLLSKSVKDADLVIEATPERLELKQKLIAEVSKAAPLHAIFASNTSVIPITLIGQHLDSQARSRLLGTHWWNPPHLIPLVEVVKTEFTSPEVCEQTFSWLELIGKRPVRVNKDVTGFIGNRLQVAMWREAIGLIEDGVCDGNTIDLVVKNSFGMRLPVLGPIENADLVGLELTRDIFRVMLPDLRNDKFPSPLLEKLITQGHTGMKAGKGLRPWSTDDSSAVRSRLAKHLMTALEARSQLKPKS